jgi:hypothetical protein
MIENGELCFRSDYSDTLYAARCIADCAVEEGVLTSHAICRPVYDHMGAVLADSILQAGLNYMTVVRPRIASILKMFPRAATVTNLIEITEKEGSQKFLQWQHPEKVSRFDELVSFMVDAEIENTNQLSIFLHDDSFRKDLRRVRGVGPKTIDYMSCLVGIDCIAVDRHIRGFADFVGLADDSYDYLRKVFSFAADLLSVSRRDFDACIWQYQATKFMRQSAFHFS